MSSHPASIKLPDEFRALSHSILTCANRGEPKIDFMREVSTLLLKFSGCDAIKIFFREDGKYSCCSTRISPDGSLNFNLELCSFDFTEQPTVGNSDAALRFLSWTVMKRRTDPSLPFFTDFGSFWTGNSDRPLIFGQVTSEYNRLHGLEIGGDHLSLALIPVMVVEDCIGLLSLQSCRREHFTLFDIGLYETAAQALGVALVNHRAQAALRERVKELTCLYGIATLSEKPGISSGEILQGIADLIPPAWQYPEITCGKIVMNGTTYSSPGGSNGTDRQVADIIVQGKKRGYVEVSYTEQKPILDEGPFLKEERNLIDAIASQIALIIEQKQAEEDRQRLQDQLRHADRLATIGQLAAGVAHELNEPLGGILGFAQLAEKGENISAQTLEDIQKIINATLHAREVVKKLMLFSRQMPTRKSQVDLNKMVKEGLYFLESRCAKAGIEMVRNLFPGMPQINADQSQLYQVLVNLAVNAVQAMPAGGKLTISTGVNENNVVFMVEDTGTGMNKEVMGKLFMPFFTTKDVNEGTGLGLSVVHGIVTSHGGTIKVASEVGKGSRFTVLLPVVEKIEGGSDGQDD